MFFSLSDPGKKGKGFFCVYGCNFPLPEIVIEFGEQALIVDQGVFFSSSFGDNPRNDWPLLILS